MFQCNDTARLLAFFQADPVRFRHILHDLDSPCPAWDEAMDSLLRRAGASSGWRGSTHVDSLEEISLVAQVRGRHVRVEGCMTDEQGGRFVAWCRDRGIRTIETWSQAVYDRLSPVTRIGAVESGAASTRPAGRSSMARIEHHVRRLTAGDEGIWRRFVERNASDSMVNARPGSQTAVRDFVFMCRGLPVDYYAALEGGEITGVISVNPMTRTIDEISMLFVEPGHRRKGIGAA